MTLRLHFGYLGHHFGDPEIQGVTQRALGGPGIDFSDFRIILGRLWEALWAQFFVFDVFFSSFSSHFPVIWDAKMGDCFQVHVFSDPGMEMIPECRGCM